MNGSIARTTPLGKSASARAFTKSRAQFIVSTKHVRHYTEPAIAGVSPDETRSARQYCSNLLRRFDTPSHTLQTFIPPGPPRDTYLSLRALNIDISRIADTTSNPQVGRLRMQFWRDAVSKALERKPPKEPVAVLLAYAASTSSAPSTASTSTSTTSTTSTGGVSIPKKQQQNLSKGFLKRVIDERDKRLHNPPFPDLTTLESYAENTYSTLLYLTLQGIGIRASVAADHVASHIGKAQGITAVLRGLPLIAFPGPPNKHANQAAFGGVGEAGRQGAVMLPLDVMARCGVREEDVFRKGAEAAGLRDAVFEVATRASDHLITAREMVENLRKGEGVGHDFEHADDVERTEGGAAGDSDSISMGAASHDANSKPNGAASSSSSSSSLSSNKNSRDLQDVESAFGVYMPAVATQLWLDKLQKCDFDVFDDRLRTSDWRLPLWAWWAFRRKVF
ncbi:MAG: hypothetical protein M1831_004349 [Alyxoria varia]|nr:MAG: hypothetical protein M1831_004349 [Alyxoria varia]